MKASFRGSNTVECSIAPDLLKVSLGAILISALNIKNTRLLRPTLFDWYLVEAGSFKFASANLYRSLAVWMTTYQFKFEPKILLVALISYCRESRFELKVY